MFGGGGGGVKGLGCVCNWIGFLPYIISLVISNMVINWIKYILTGGCINKTFSGPMHITHGNLL